MTVGLRLQWTLVGANAINVLYMAAFGSLGWALFSVAMTAWCYYTARRMEAGVAGKQCGVD